jgi:hypothetical protein
VANSLLVEDLHRLTDHVVVGIGIHPSFRLVSPAISKAYLGAMRLRGRQGNQFFDLGYPPTQVLDPGHLPGSRFARMLIDFHLSVE